MNVDDPDIGDEEILYRRVSVNSRWYSDGVLSSIAFSPQKHDETGISLFRAKHKNIEQAAEGPSSDGYFVARLRVGDVRRCGMTVAYRPHTASGFDASHVEIAELNYADRKTSLCIECREQLADLVLDVPGPFPSNPQ